MPKAASCDPRRLTERSIETRGNDSHDFATQAKSCERIRDDQTLRPLQRLDGIRGKIHVERLIALHQLHALCRTRIGQHYDVAAIGIAEPRVRHGRAGA